MADFSTLRLLLASSVIFTHFAAITGLSPGWIPAISATVAVQGFFVVSGWLVCASYDASTSAQGYFVRRFARLYPLYFVVIGVQALVALLVADSARIRAGELLAYLAANLTFANFLRPTLFGLFEGDAVAAINPSLWTLKIEVLFYLTVPALVYLLRRGGGRWMLALFAASTLFVYVVAPRSAELGRQLPGQLRFFIAGVACWQFAKAGGAAKVRRGWMLGTGLVGLFLSHRLENVYWASALQPALVATFVFWAAHALPSLGRFPDISYGVYLWHSPIIQFGGLLGWLPSGGLAIVPVLLATALAALASSYVIEEPAIRAGRSVSRRLNSRARAHAVRATEEVKEVSASSALPRSS